MIEKCQKCQEEGEDRRTLWMACFYDMDELNIPFQKRILSDSNNYNCPHELYTLRVCKDCRADWLTFIKDWYNWIPNRESCNSGIFVRHFGANIEITEEEWRERAPGIEPVRCKDES